MIHLISGLAADKKAFKYLELSSNYLINHVTWIANLKDESLESYAERIIVKNNILSTDILLGLSFGGCLASEIAKQLKNENIILISSFTHKSGLKPWIQLATKLRIHKLIPNLRMSFLNPIISKVFGAKSKEGKDVIMQMLENRDLVLTKWSLSIIANYKFLAPINLNIHYIIGKKDKLVSIPEKVCKTIIIDEGGHFMVFEKAQIVSEYINRILFEISYNTNK